MTSSAALVMGVGRSGTTAIYALLQDILQDAFPDDVDYVYEPFLWERKVFNKPYKNITDEFNYAASVSIEGMYHNKRIPILVGDKYEIDPVSHEWLKETLTARGGKKKYLGKMIRANGRIRLIREIAPGTKIIFIIRNPVDVLNSSSQLFSFFGSEFHESDLSRFAKEVEEQYGRGSEVSKPDPKYLVSEFCYWYFSNLAFLKYARESPTNILSIAYEAFIEDRERVVRQLCDFLGLEFQSDFAEASKKERGPVQHGTTALSEVEFSFLHSKLTIYDSLLESVDLVPNGSLLELVKTSSWNPALEPRLSALPFNSLHAGKVLNKTIGDLQRKEFECDRLDGELARIMNSHRYRLANRLLAPIDALRKRKT